MPIDASFAVNVTEWQIGPVGTVAGALPVPEPTPSTEPMLHSGPPTANVGSIAGISGGGPGSW